MDELPPVTLWSERKSKIASGDLGREKGGRRVKNCKCKKNSQREEIGHQADRRNDQAAVPKVRPPQRPTADKSSR